MNNILFTGIIEDRNDPLNLGRARVRIFGLHTEDKNKLPTETLPWGTMLSPNLGTSSSGALIPGSYVAIMFLDKDQQMPLILGGVGNLPSYEESCSDVSSTDSTGGAGSSDFSNAPSDLPPLAKAVTHGEAKSYDAWYGHGNGAVLPSLNKKPTECTIGEIMQNAKARIASAGGSAVGIYQWVPPTFTAIVKKAGMSMSDKFIPETQNLLFLRGYCSVSGLRPGIGKYLAGDKNNNAALNNALQDCAKEWASVEWSINGVGTGNIYSAYQKNNKLGTKIDVVKQGLLEQWEWNKANKK